MNKLTKAALSFGAMAACFITLAVNNAARADTFTVHLASEHVTASGKDYGFNEVNPGLGYGYTVNKHVRAIIGGYDNSMGRTTWYTGAEFYARTNLPILTEVGIDVGVLTGYSVPVGAVAYARVFDALKVTAMPIVISHPTRGVYADGVALGFSITLGE